MRNKSKFVDIKKNLIFPSQPCIILKLKMFFVKILNIEIEEFLHKHPVLYVGHEQIFKNRLVKRCLFLKYSLLSTTCILITNCQIVIV